MVFRSGGPLKAKQVKDFNLLLESFENRGQHIFIQHQVEQKHLAAADFKMLMASDTAARDFQAFFSRAYSRHTKGLASGTIKQMHRTKELFQRFRKNVFASGLNTELIEDFELYMRGQQLAPNTRAKHHRNLKIFMLKACRKWQLDSPYEEFKMPRAETEREYLTTNEVNMLTDLLQSGTLNKEEHLALQKYLFCCHFGGLRISDVHAVGPEDVIDHMLVFVPKKTRGINKTVKVPLKKGWQTYVQHTSGKRFFDVRADQFINRTLKRIAQLSGIKKRITFHTARHTFATGYLAAGGSIEVLQQLLRHSKIETTQVYVHITNQRMREESERINLFGDSQD